MKLERPVMEVIEFESDDVIATSSCHGDCSDVCKGHCGQVCDVCNVVSK